MGVDVLAALAQSMFRDGIPGKEPGKPGYPSVRSKFDEWELLPQWIRFLCLTGGTSLIPDFEDALRASVLTAPVTQQVRTRDLVRLNVVRGAARRPGLRLHGRLPCAVQLWAGRQSKELHIGSVAGETMDIRAHFQPGVSLPVEVRAAIPGQATCTLFSTRVANDDNYQDGLFLRAQLAYGAGQVLRLRLAWLTNPERQVMDWTAIQQVPSR